MELSLLVMKYSLDARIVMTQAQLPSVINANLGTQGLKIISVNPARFGLKIGHHMFVLIVSLVTDA